MSKGKLFFRSCVAFIAGISAASFFNVSQPFWLGFLLLGSLWIFLFWLDRRFAVAGLLLISFAFGGLRYQAAANEMFGSKLKEFNDTGQAIVLSGLVDEEPEMRNKSQQLRIRTKEGEKILVVARRYPEYRYGDRLEMTGELKAPENSNGFDYRSYLQKEGIYSTSVFPQIKLLEREQGNPLRQILFGFKNQFQLVWRRLLSPPQLGIFEALVFGAEENIPPEWKEKLNLSGTRHLTAVSGMNITIISFLLTGLLLNLGFWRAPASLVSLIFIWLFILMIGAPASALRAGVMVSLFLWAQSLGRLADGSRVLAWAAVILLAENPLLLRFDVGFQLSFLALAGLIYWQAFFKGKVFKRLPEFLKSSLSTTFAAQVFTGPILVYNFGYFSLVSPLTNLLLVPLVPYLTLAGFFFGVLGLISLPLGQVLSWLLWLGLSGLLLIIDLSLKIPFSHVAFDQVSVLFLASALVFLAYLTWRINRDRGPEFLSF
ncbi:MAG: ComEC family competence protein [Candidatus Nealsonbacteria bacterium]|nr:ComEC family competence protein [Candidatus Nealsonbacteria bacterium]